MSTNGGLTVDELSIESPRAGVITGRVDVSTPSSEFVTSELPVYLDGQQVLTDYVSARNDSPGFTTFEITDVAPGEHEVCVEIA